MLNDPLIRYELFKAEQRALRREAEHARRAREATPNAPGWIEPMEAAPDLSGLVERVLQNVWKRLGLPAREPARPDGGQGRLSSGKIRPAHTMDIPLFDLQ